MILAILQIVAYIYYFLGFAILSETACAIEESFLVFGIFYLGFLIVLLVFSIYVANKARNEIIVRSSIVCKRGQIQSSTHSYTSEPDYSSLCQITKL